MIITEPAREIDIVREVDVVVVGGGPGGVASAVSSARTGAKTILVERYGHLGGMATGGLVNAIPNLSTIDGDRTIKGIMQETIDRIAARGAAHVVDEDLVGKHDAKTIDLYQSNGYSIFYVRKHPEGDLRIIYGALLDPEILKQELNAMCLEADVDLLLHASGVLPIVENGTVRGIIIESKSGRQAILAKVVIDSTGDGDLFVRAGAGFDAAIAPGARHGNLCLSCWITGVDMDRLDAFRRDHAADYESLITEMYGMKLTGFMQSMQDVLDMSKYFVDGFFRDTLLPDHSSNVILQPHLPSTDQADVNELTRVNLLVQGLHVKNWEFLRAHVPGFERSYIVQTAAQLGTTGGRRVEGEYMVTVDDALQDRVFEDTVAVFPNLETGGDIAIHPRVCIPYRALIPKKIEGLLVACRGYSTSDDANEYWNLIPHCMCLGQAAGTAAAIAAKGGVSVRAVDTMSLRNALIGQNVVLP